LGGDGVEVRLAGDEAEIEAAKKLRVQVFADEQGIPSEGDSDGLDPAATHIVAVRRGAIVGTCRLRFLRGRCKLERMAVDATLRGTGIGTDLVKEAEREAARQGASEVTTHAQREAEGFYATCGYVAEGDTFLEEGIPHVLMRKRLGPADDRRSGRDRRAP
jgi:predicted GNAT family N-acyltransferase